MRRAFPTRRLSASTFREATSSAPYLLVRVEPDAPVIHGGVAEFFDRQYPKLFGFGTLRLRETRARGWWDANFRTAVGPARGNRTGYWLFQEAKVIGHHSGLVRTDLTFTDRRAAREDSQRAHAETAWIREVAFDGADVAAVDLAAAVQLIAYFDGIVCTRQNRAGFGEGATREACAAPARVTAQEVPIPGASGDPFEVLRVAPTATDDEIRAAYKLQMKLNHPDKVAHMSEHIQAYAHAQVRVIRAAYDAITAVRGRVNSP